MNKNEFEPSSEADRPGVVVVGGGTGNIGEGIVRAGLKSGATVVVPSRSQTRLDALQRYVTDAGIDATRLELVRTDIGTFDGARDFVESVASKHGRIDLSVASLGGWWSGPPLLHTEDSAWKSVMANNLDAHYYFARHAVPIVSRTGGAHILIGGPGNLLPNPRSTLITIAGHAQLALSQLLDAEAKPLGGRVYQLFVANIFDRQRGRQHDDGNERPDVITPDQIGSKVVELHHQRPEPTVHKLFATAVPGFPL
ncbi:SDR family NAD(P)-dependent oxidoreductase [Streptomyces griseoruber]|uniref:SDR family NAD(P)-dependent oxidoreductase n=1 Tax=Streptomyces griseoruber TaxID=1943 RepID=UPI0037917593